MESGKTTREGISGRLPMRATFNASAGFPMRGRESNEVIGETLNGVQANSIIGALDGICFQKAFNHNLIPGVDPYVKKGDPCIRPCIAKCDEKRT